MGRLFIVMGLALAGAGCIEVFRYDLAPPTLDNIVASDGVAWICTPGREAVRLRSARVTDEQVCGWTPKAPETYECISLASIDRVVVRRTTLASAFEPLQAPSRESAAHG